MPTVPATYVYCRFIASAMLIALCYYSERHSYLTIYVCSTVLGALIQNAKTVLGDTLILAIMNLALPGDKTLSL